MATATIYASAGDGLVRRYGAAWATIRAATTGDDVNATGTGDYGVWAEHTNPGIGRSFYPFDTGTALQDGVTVTAASLFVYVTAASASAGGSFMVVESTQASTSTLTTSDYNKVGTTELSSRVNFSGLATSAYLEIPLNASGIALVSSTGFTKLALRSSFDLDNSAPGASTSEMQVRYSEYASTTYDPYLYVTYSPPARTTSDSWAWSDSVGVTGGGGTVITQVKTSSDTWAWSDSTTEYWRAKLQPVTVQAAGASTTLNGSHTFTTGTVTVGSTTGFPSSGTFVVSSSWTQTEVTYTGKTGTTFTGCTGGSGTFGNGSLVMARDSQNNFPQVTVLDATDTPQILVAWIQKPGHGGTIGAKIVGKTSTDGGRSWGSQSNIVASTVNSGWGIGGFVIARLKNGRLLISWYEGSSGGLVRSYLKYSDDSGATWSSASAQLTSPYPGGTDVCAVGFARYVDTSGSANATYGDLYLTCYGNDSATYDNTATYNRLMKITDGGAAGTWTSVSTINTLAQLDGRASEEASLSVLDTGTWVSHMRVEVLAPTYTTLDRYQATSTDNGATWSGHTQIHDGLANAAVSHQMPETHLITQGTDMIHGGQTITYFSTDRGTTWTDSTAYYRLEATDGTYTGGNGSDFLTIASTAVPGRRVLNVISQELANQSAAQVRFQWYEVPNLPLTTDAWAWTDSAAVTARSFSRAVSNTWAWTDSASGALATYLSRTTADTWAWSDTATRTSGTPIARTTADTWTWSDAAADTYAGPHYYSRTTSDTWSWSDSTGTAGTALYWLRAARRRSMSAPTKTYTSVQPKGTTRTATWTSPTYKAETEAGILVVLDVTAASGTGGLTLRINAHDQASSQAVPLNAAPSAVTAVGTTSYALYPFGAVAGSVTQATSFYLPRMFSISVTHEDSSSYTYSLGYCLLP